MGLLDGHRAVITGAASGIGRATAQRLAREGAQVAVLDVNAAGARAVATDLGASQAREFVVDVTDVEAVQVAVDAAADWMGGITILFNNAGNSNLSGLHEWDPLVWESIVRLNLSGVFHGFRAAVPHMLAGFEREGTVGRIVSTSSISGTRPAPGEAPYSAAKAAVAAITASAALEYAPAIRVNAVAPGMIRTGLTSVMLDAPGRTEHMVTKTPMARIGEPEDIADVVLFLVSDLSRFVTGQNIVIDGGMTLHGAGVDGMLEWYRDLVTARR